LFPSQLANNCKGFATIFFYGIRSSALSPTLNQWGWESWFWGALPLEELSSLRLEPPPPFAVYKPYQCPSFPPCIAQFETLLTSVFGSILVQGELLPSTWDVCRLPSLTWGYPFRQFRRTEGFPLRRCCVVVFTVT
jgi:hypothetical protein